MSDEKNIPPAGPENPTREFETGFKEGFESGFKTASEKKSGEGGRDSEKKQDGEDKPKEGKEDEKKSAHKKSKLIVIACIVLTVLLVTRFR